MTQLRMTAAKYRKDVARNEAQHALALWLTDRLAPIAVVQNIKFLPTRKHQLDIAFPEFKIAIEVHGGAHSKRADGNRGGAHHSAEGRRRDMFKVREAQMHGWLIAEFEPKDDPHAVLDWIQRALALRERSSA